MLIEIKKYHLKFDHKHLNMKKKIIISYIPLFMDDED